MGRLTSGGCTSFFAFFAEEKVLIAEFLCACASFPQRSMELAVSMAETSHWPAAPRRASDHFHLISSTAAKMGPRDDGIKIRTNRTKPSTQKTNANLGLVTPLGVGVTHAWPRLIKAECGIRGTYGKGFKKEHWNRIKSQ